MKNAEKMQKMIEIIKKLDKTEYSYLKQYLKTNFTEKQLNTLDLSYSTKDMVVSTQKLEKESSISKIYQDEILKISTILNNAILLKNIGGLKILFYGATGTGKTSLVNEIIKINYGYKFISKSLEELISPKMGQTQINLISLAKNLNSSYKDKKIILFIDEIDSIINSRTNINDVAEHGRIVSTFIKFLDALDKNIVLFAATNLIKSIDTAVQRRFNVKVKGVHFTIDDFFTIFKNEGGIITSHDVNKIKSIVVNNNFTISELKEFKNVVEIEKTVVDKFDVKLIFIKLFYHKILIKNRKWSQRDILNMKREGISVNL